MVWKPLSLRMGACLAIAEPYWAMCEARFLCRDLDADVRGEAQVISR
ncbi:hypothetical protein [Synechococcus sp. NOUM97013]|nr:hypothetical protein [Synechococcus sp. NOUM97013]QNI74508.1 hypothetical protein SynNOUM97013_02461 [Synechococcus sp. NOUM97013]